MAQAIPAVRVAVIVAVLFCAGPHAENVDPDDTGAQFAWCENAGWINAEPSGDGGPGLQVDDFELTGWMWGENVGWISLSCKNTDGCEALSFGVRNDGRGVLSGRAWGENVGWIDFSPNQAGVSIDTATGEFGGHAWGENVGWIRFRSTGAHPFVLRTAWRCAPPPPAPEQAPWLLLDKSDDRTWLSWAPVAAATGYDVVHGDLALLRGPGGGFVAATTGCARENRTVTSTTDAAVPPVGAGVWYLVRGVNCGGAGTYDASPSSQAAPRDDDIRASGNDCRDP